ncbi:MAG: hypothetical protein HYT12_03655 [Candidatus Liptonbacteria bacterium]|nr:hypothetical protein [Candidatus Liptonbacteria bacterium]
MNWNPTIYLLWLTIKYLIVASAIAYGFLWLIFRFYVKEYEMDAKSQIMISFKTFGTFILINFVFLLWLPPISTSILPPFFLSIGASLFVAHRLLIKAGMEKKETWRVAMPWFAAMLAFSLIFMSVEGII